MNNVIPLNFQGQLVRFNSDGWINATEAAAQFGNRRRGGAWAQPFADDSWPQPANPTARSAGLRMKVCPFLFQGKPVLHAHEILHGAESTFVRSPCNNEQVGAHRAVEFPHAESFSSWESDSLIEIKSFSDVVSRLFNSSPGKNSEMDHSVPTITGKDCLILLRLSIRKYRQVLHGAEKVKAFHRAWSATSNGWLLPAQ